MQDARHPLADLAILLRLRVRGGRSLPRGTLLAGALILLRLALPAPDAKAVIIDSGNGTGNTSAPTDDPGWANVGTRGSLTVVYLRNRWVLTANHVGMGTIVLGGESYDPIADSKVQMLNPDDSPADVAVFRLYDDPGLPALTIATSTPPANNTTITMIGHGLDRGAATSWQGVGGWLMGSSRTMRWGTNRVSANSQFALDTHTFYSDFDEIGGTGGWTSHECHAANGDSGGAVFRKTSGSWRLIGTLVGIQTYGGQPSNTVLYGNRTHVADLAVYRDQIVAIIDTPSCSDGLDDDGDGATDYPADPGCDSPSDDSERAPQLECDDGLDNDGDNLVDFPADPDCREPAFPFEDPIYPVPASGPAALVVLTGTLLSLGATRARRLRAQSSI